ncbi:MAG: hypothetical protein QG604_855 [Candidatus Dependentiae bacterium]|nr:hypothetical protein [Candidatus Dependentiae bacterium]
MLAIFMQLRRLSDSHSKRGAIAQLVERMNGIHEATGSNPVSSTSLRPFAVVRLGERRLRLAAPLKAADWWSAKAVSAALVRRSFMRRWIAANEQRRRIMQ